MRYLLFDVDGVLADCTHRLSAMRVRDYDTFYSGTAMSNDTPIDNGWELLKIFTTIDVNADEGVRFIIMTGRPERTRKITEMWLQYQNTQGFYFPMLEKMYMRADGDHRPSSIIKQEQLDQFYEDFIPDNSDTIIFVDDDPANCMAVSERYEKALVLTFGTNRMGEDRKEKSNETNKDS